MANQWLTGAGVPSTGVGQVTDYYRDTASNLVYYRENAFTWVVVPAFTPTPDGIGTTWLHGNVPPLTGQGSDGDYFYEDTHKIVYRKEGATWVAKGSLDFIGIYGVQWGNGIGAPASTVPLNALPAGSFYLNVETSDIYYKEPSMSWVLKGQLGGGGGGGSSVTVEDVLNSTSTVNALSANQGKVLNDTLALTAPLASPALTGTPTAPTVNIAVNSDQIATTSFAHTVANAAEDAAKAYADGLVVNLWDDRGTYAVPVGGEWPTSGDGGSGPDNEIMKGDTWSISTGGTLTGGKVVAVGDVVRALVDNAGNTSADWGITESNLGYVAENSTNKATNLTSPNNTKYPTTQAVVTGLAENLNLLRYAITTPTIVANAYTVVSTDVNAYGNKILKLTSASTIAVTLPTPATLGATVGDSFNIRQGGAGGITITGTISGASTTTTINTTMTLIAESSTSWMAVGS